MSGDFPGFMREVFEFMSATKTTLGAMAQTYKELAQRGTHSEERLIKIEQQLALLDQIQCGLVASSGASPCTNCPTRIHYEKFMQEEWPSIRNKVIFWSGGLAFAGFALSILVKVL